MGDNGLVTHLDIRQALPTDAAAVREVIERAIRVSAAGAYPAAALEAWAAGRSQEDVERMIAATRGFVAVIGGAVVGWANLDGDEVDQLYVDPDAGGGGVARRLYEAVEQLARDDGLPQLRAVSSLRAESAFCRFGFHEVTRGEQPFNGHAFTVVHMTKPLDEQPRR